ncbi:RICIN domain-containing protein (plasmid) [Streptomyces sp. NBC_00597]|uniref:RICIN domain-containing protein n=1 Tax=unclassified Streptomyces TaxID=2593676 RepID=UPI002F90A367
MSVHGSRTAWAAALLSAAVGGGLLTAGPATALSGSDAPGSGYAFAAKLNVGDKASCSGALVDAQWVITAASCFRNGSAAVPAGKPALKTTVTVGRTDLTQSTGTVVEAAELVPHADRDLVMVKLAWRVVGVEPVKVATTAPLAGEQLTSLGFGRTKTEWVPDKAHTGVFTVASVDGGTLGLNASGGAVVCKGDAGGPALRQTDGGPELAAVNSRSWQGGCLGTDAAETRTGALDVRVDDVAAWVDQVRKTTPAVRLASVVPNVTKVMGTGDFNQDGRTDIAAVTTDGNLHTFAGRPDGTFEYGRPLWRADGSWGPAKKIIGGDFNGDGFTDIASVWSNGALRLYAGRSDGSLADGKAMWADASTNWDAMRQLDRYRAPGSDRDGLIAVWGTGDAKGSLHAYSTTADGVLTSQSRKMWPDNTWLGIQKITTGDFNNDGRDDVVAIASDGALRRYSGDAAGGLDTGVSMWHDTAWNNMPVLLSGDFNGDGKTDLGGLWSNQQRFNFYRGNGQGAVAPGANAWPSPLPLPAGGQIRNMNSGKCLEISGSSKDDDAPAQQWTCGAQAGAKWELRPTATAGVYQIVNVNSGKCLEIINSIKDNGARAQQYTCHDIPTMLWTIKQAGSTVSLNISNVNSGKTLEISDSSKDNGAPAQQWEHSSDPSFATQSWYL